MYKEYIIRNLSTSILFKIYQLNINNTENAKLIKLFYKWFNVLHPDEMLYVNNNY